MDLKKIIEKLSLTDFPVALGGCRNDKTSFDCCEYDLTVFDEKKEHASIIDFENETIRLHHGSMKETNPNMLIQYSNMQIIWDEKWELRIFLSQILDKRDNFFNACSKSCIVDAAVCLTKTKDCIKNSDPFSALWLKCAAYYIADAIVFLNHKRPSPSHFLEQIRTFEKNKINEKFSHVNESLGIERATPSQLQRMCKSTMGFSDMVEGNWHSKIIQKKHDYFVKNSLISDCYFYLGYITRNNFIKIKDTLHRKPELIHVLKVAFDVENDMTRLEQQTILLNKTANDLLLILNG